MPKSTPFEYMTIGIVTSCNGTAHIKGLIMYFEALIPNFWIYQINNSIFSFVDSTIILDQEQTMPHATTGLSRSVNGSRKLPSRKGAEEIVSDGCPKSSPSASKRHFAPFFSSKVANAEEKPTKRSLPLETRLNNLFDKYKDSDDENLILAEGVERLCSDLNLRPDDFKVLILAWKFNAEQMFQFTRQEFLSGCKALDAESVAQIQSRLSECLTQLVNDSSQFKSLYKFTFKFGLDRASGQRILPIDMAICLWKLVFTLNKPVILERWLTFLQSDKTYIRGVPRDTWNMFLNFTETIGNDLSTYNDAEAWPSIFDDFVEYENDRLNQNVVSGTEVRSVKMVE